MKCIRYYNPESRIIRVSDDEAQRAVSAGKAHYISRSAWKKNVRDVAKSN